MPIIAQAAKKLRHDRKRTKQTASRRRALADVIKSTRKSPSAKNLTHSFTALDKAVKLGIVHKNKAARLKSRLSKLMRK